MKLEKVALTNKEAAQRAELTRAPKPKLASTIVLYTGPKDNPKILMGQRASRHDFMPSVYVFPGGRVDRVDSYAPYDGGLSSRTSAILESVYSPRRARACVLAAIRETYEETGLMLGQKTKWTKNLTNPSWDQFRQAGITPDLSRIEAFGRAITPSYRHKRFDTWFFIQKFDGNIQAVSDSHELLNVDWFTFDQIEDLKTHRATEMMLHVLKEYLAQDRPSPQIFFNHMVRGKFIQRMFP